MNIYYEPAMDENPFPQIIFICKTDARDGAILRLLESRVSDNLVFVLFGWNTINRGYFMYIVLETPSCSARLR